MLVADMMRFGTTAAQRDLDDRYFLNHHPMMWLAGNNTSIFWFFGLLWLVTWVIGIVALVALARWLWKKGDNETKGR